MKVRKKKKTLFKRKKIVEPLDLEEFGSWGTSEFNSKNIKNGEDEASISRVKEKETSFPTPLYTRRGDMNKQSVA